MIRAQRLIAEWPRDILSKGGHEIENLKVVRVAPDKDLLIISSLNFGLLAQWQERPAHNRRVECSNHSGSTKVGRRMKIKGRLC